MTISMITAYVAGILAFLGLAWGATSYDCDWTKPTWRNKFGGKMLPVYATVLGTFFLLVSFVTYR